VNNSIIRLLSAYTVVYFYTFHSFDLDTILEELKRLLDTEEGDANVMPIQDDQPRSASNDWAIRTEMREERWKETRSSLVENILKGEDASSSSCQQCRSSAAVVRCRDCLPYPFLCAGCDEKRHGSFFVLHNRDSLVSGFVQPLPPSTGFCQEAGQISVKHLGKIMLCYVVLLLFYCARNISCF